jgi:hypothetical protein
VASPDSVAGLKPMSDGSGLAGSVGEGSTPVLSIMQNTHTGRHIYTGQLFRIAYCSHTSFANNTSISRKPGEVISWE